MSLRNVATAFVLQGGGALGAYQAAVACRLAEGGIVPDRVAGISIGAINGALIAGNPPSRRAERLREFWGRITAATDWPLLPPQGPLSAGLAVVAGVPGFFKPRIPPAVFASADNPEEASFYDTAPLRRTLEELVDFDLLNGGPVRLILGAVNVATGNFTWFDTRDHRLTVDHVMASGALPPGFPPIRIGGEFYWDGGLVSNTPLSRVVDTRTDHAPLVIWQMDLFSARGPLPRSVWQIEAREKDIRFSSRTRAVTDRIRETHDLACALQAHEAALPKTLRAHPAVARLLDGPARGPLTLIHLIYRSKAYETGAKDYDFSHAAMRSHWAAGEDDATRSLAHPALQAHDPGAPGIHVFDPADERTLRSTG